MTNWRICKECIYYKTCESEDCFCLLNSVTTDGDSEVDADRISCKEFQPTPKSKRKTIIKFHPKIVGAFRWCSSECPIEKSFKGLDFVETKIKSIGVPPSCNHSETNHAPCFTWYMSKLSAIQSYCLEIMAETVIDNCDGSKYLVAENILNIMSEPLEYHEVEIVYEDDSVSEECPNSKE